MANARQLEFGDIAQETVWGTAATTGFVGMPWESYTVDETHVAVVRAKLTGFVDDLNVDSAGRDLAGAAEAEVHPDDATLLCKTIPGIPRVTFNGNPNDYPSFTHRFYDAARNEYRRQTGLKCNQIRYSCAGPDGEFKVSIDFQGKIEEPVATFAQPTMYDQASFMMRHAWSGGASLIKVASIAEPNCENFDITVPNNNRLAERRDDSGVRNGIDPGHRGEVTVTMGLRTATDWAVDYHGLVRGLNSGTRLEYTFNYPGTGSPVDQVQIILPSALIRTCPKQGSPHDVQTTPTTWVAKRTAAGESIQINVT